MFILLLRLHAVGQMESGTLVVFNVTHDEIVAAADSRTHTRTAYADDRCKISALGNKMIFAAAGKTAHGPFDKPTKLTWDASAIARKEFDYTLYHGVKGSLSLNVARAWGSEVKKRLNADLVREQDDVLSGVQGDALIQAIFAGFQGDGAISVVFSKITYRISSGKPTTSFVIDRVVTTPQLVAVGRNEVVAEIVSSTRRGLAWKQEIESSFSRDGDPVALYAIGLIGATEKYLPPTNIQGHSLVAVGGPIDVLRLRRSGGIEWIQRKRNCRAD